MIFILNSSMGRLLLSKERLRGPPTTLLVALKAATTSKREVSNKVIRIVVIPTLRPGSRKAIRLGYRLPNGTLESSRAPLAFYIAFSRTRLK